MAGPGRAGEGVGWQWRQGVGSGKKVMGRKVAGGAGKVQSGGRIGTGVGAGKRLLGGIEVESRKGTCVCVGEGGNY